MQNQKTYQSEKSFGTGSVLIEQKFHFKMKGSVTGKVVEWSKGETMDQMEDTFSAWDYTIFALLLVISTGLSLNSLNILTKNVSVPWVS